MTPLIGIDTNILVYASRRTQEGDQQDTIELRKRTLFLLDQLSAKSNKIVVSTVALSEFLVGIKPQNRAKVTQAILSRCIVKPIDIPTADLAASLWAKHTNLPPELRIKRILFKVDVLVVAACKIAGANVFYSHDAKCRALAKLADLEARDLPVQGEDLFSDADIKKGVIETGLEEE